MYLILQILMLLALTGVAFAADIRLTVPDPKDFVAVKIWEELVDLGFSSGDTLLIDGRSYLLGPELRSGEGGRVHLLPGFSPPRIIKIQRRINSRLKNRHLKAEIESLQALKERGVSVPALYEMPHHSFYLVKEYLDGEVLDDYFNNMEKHPVIEIVHRLKLVAELLSHLAHWNLKFDDLHSGNLLFLAKSNDCLAVFDPGALSQSKPYNTELVNDSFFGSQRIAAITLSMLRFLMNKAGSLSVTPDMESLVVEALTQNQQMSMLENISFLVWGNGRMPRGDENLRQHLQKITGAYYFSQMPQYQPDFEKVLKRIFGTNTMNESTILSILSTDHLTIPKIKLLRELVSISLNRNDGIDLKNLEKMFNEAMLLASSAVPTDQYDPCAQALESLP